MAFSFNLRTAAAPQDTSYHKTVHENDMAFFASSFMLLNDFPALTF